MVSLLGALGGFFFLSIFGYLLQGFGVWSSCWMVLTVISSEDFVNIGWDSAGVTTGPVTVPLVLAMGLGLGSQVGSIEGFGILSLASVCPILSVLLVGLYVTGRRKAELEESV